MSVVFPIASAAGAALCYGTGTVLQDVAAHRVEQSTSLDLRLLLRLGRQLPYLSGLAVDFLGWVLSLVALRSLPLFVVQPAVSASVGVTAVGAAIFLHERLNRSQIVAVGLLLVGLTFLGLCASAEGPGHIGAAGGGLLLCGTGVVAIAGVVCARTKTHRTGPVLASLAGVAFGGTALAARVLVVPDIWTRLLRDPVVWALVAYGVLGTLLFATALQHGPVTIVTAALFASETIGPAAIGVLFLGDRVKPGTAPLAVSGFIVTITCVLVLSLRRPIASAPPISGPGEIDGHIRDDLDRVSSTQASDSEVG